MRQNLLKVLGNDVVDLQQAKLDSNWERKGFLTKVCSFAEQQLIRNSKDPFSTFWLLWTMKEAAYKVVNRVTGQRDFRPVNFVCQQIQRTARGATAVVVNSQFKLLIRAEINQHFIHSQAVGDPASFADLCTYKMQASTDYISRFNSNSDIYSLAKNKLGLPELIERLSGKKYAATVSHHGRYLFIVYSGSLQLIN